MLLKQVQVGGKYLCTVSGQRVTVVVLALREGDWVVRGRRKTFIDCRNERTGRVITLRSAQRLSLIPRYVYFEEKS